MKLFSVAFLSVVAASILVSLPVTQAAHNAARQLETGIVSPSRPCWRKTVFLRMSTTQLYNYATQRSVGGCRISVDTGGGFCDLYVKSATTGQNGYNGWPRTRDNRGTGCVKAPDFPKRRSVCFFASSQYDLPQAVRSSFCTNNGRENAVAQLKHAISNGQCKLCRVCKRWEWE